jgi:methylphosphotriester-DNA--protein-cysteine methyltransferase
VRHIKKSKMLSMETQAALNFEDLTNIQFGWDFRVTQLGPIVMESSVALYRGPRVGYSRFRFNCTYEQRLHTRAGRVTFGLLEPDCPPVWLYDQVIPNDALIVFPREEDMKAATPVGFRGNGVHFEESFLDAVAQAVHGEPLSALMPTPGIYSLAPSKVCTIRAEFQKWRQMADRRAADVAPFVARREESLAMAVLDGIDPSQRVEQPTLLKSERALKLALEVIHDSELPDISAVELCGHTNGSQRSLEKAFLKRFGVTPKKYIKYLRLSRVRKGLLSFDSEGCESIIELAGIHGFWHMGQFAADYRKIYGELPSETLRRI